MFYEDIEDKLQLDEIGEFMPYKGKSVEEYFANRAERMGWTIRNVPGASNPGIERMPKGVGGKPESGPIHGFLDDEEKALLDK